MVLDLKIAPSGQTIVKPTALGPVANTDTKLLIYGLFQSGRVLAQDGGETMGDDVMAAALIDRILHHCHVINIRGNSYRMREHSELWQGYCQVEVSSSKRAAR